MNKNGEAGVVTDPRVLPTEVAKAVVALSAALPMEFEVFADYLDSVCTMYTSNAVWTPDNANIARGRAQAINALLTALAGAPKLATRPLKSER